MARAAQAAGGCVAPSSSPNCQRTNRRMTMFSPSCAIFCGDVFLDRDLGVLHEGLFQQADHGEKLLQLALDDLFDGLGRLVLDLGAVDFLFPLQDGGRHVLAFDVAGVGGGDLLGDVRDEGDKAFVARDEIGLAIHFHQHAEFAAVMNVAGDAPFIGGPAGFFVRHVDALLAQDHLGLVEVAFGFHQGLFAIHHARAGLFAQGLYQFGVDIHGCRAHLAFCVNNGSKNVRRWPPVVRQPAPARAVPQGPGPVPARPGPLRRPAAAAISCPARPALPRSSPR